MRDDDAAAITQAALAGDALSMRLLAGAGEHLGRGISYLLNILNPEMVVLAGPYAAAGEILLAPLRASGGAPRDSPDGVASALDAERARGFPRVGADGDGRDARSDRIVGGAS